MYTLNLTQHDTTDQQAKDFLVFCPSPEEKEIIVDLLTFEFAPNRFEIERRAKELANLAAGLGVKYKYKDCGIPIRSIMIGGAPYLMPELEKELKARGLNPVYAFSKRVSVEEQQEDGTVSKTSVFQQVSWVLV